MSAVAAAAPPSTTCINGSPACPDISDTSPIVAQKVTATPGSWSGTEPVSYSYQWQICSSNAANTCTDLIDETDTTYVTGEGDQAKYLRVVVRASNAEGSAIAPSALTSVIGPGIAGYPGDSQKTPPSITAVPPADTGVPHVGDTLHAGGWFFNPVASFGTTFQWRRCETSGTGCVSIPGATSQDYVLARDDASHKLVVRVVGQNGSGFYQLYSAPSATVSFGDADGDGVTLQSDCDDANPAIHPGAFDTPGNGIDEDCSGADATTPDGSGGTTIPAPGGTGTPAPDVTPPVIGSLALASAKFLAANSGPPAITAAAVGSKVTFTLSEAATVTFTVERSARGVRKGRSCVKPPRRPRKGAKACVRWVKVRGSFVRSGQPGANKFRFMGRMGGKALKRGSYRLTAVAKDAGSNVSKRQVRKFRIV